MTISSLPKKVESDNSHRRIAGMQVADYPVRIHGRIPGCALRADLGSALTGPGWRTAPDRRRTEKQVAFLPSWTIQRFFF